MTNHPAPRPDDSIEEQSDHLIRLVVILARLDDVRAADIVQLRDLVAEQLERVEALEAEVERLYVFRPPGSWPMTHQAKAAHFGNGRQRRTTLGDSR